MALDSGKHLFVEKPLCLTEEELNSIREKHSKSGKSLMIGFNRRFAPQVQKIKTLLETEKDPRSVIVTVNAGVIPISHWTQNPAIGGGRIVGEACHFIDLIRYLCDSKIESISSVFMDSKSKDTATISLRFENGSLGTLHYFSNGPKSFPKERIEIFCGEKVLQLDNFRTLQGFGFPGFKKMNLWRQNKGHQEEMKSWVNSLLEGKTLIPFEEIEEVTRSLVVSK
jgi:predicted dehydrogenase